MVPFSELKKQRSLNSSQLTTDLTAEATTKQKLLCRAVLPIRLGKVSVCHFWLLKTTRKCLVPETKMIGSKIRKENGKTGEKAV